MARRAKASIGTIHRKIAKKQQASGEPKPSMLQLAQAGRLRAIGIKD